MKRITVRNNLGGGGGGVSNNKIYNYIQNILGNLQRERENGEG